MKKYLYPIIISVGIILIGTLIASILYYFNITSDKINNILLYLIAITSIFTGSLMLGKNIKQKGLITGALYFLGFLVLSLLLSLIIFKTKFDISNVIFYMVLLVFSVLGGIIGKNNQLKNDVI